MKKILLVSGIFSLFALQLSATHLMGGQITARQLNGLSYEVTLTAYRDSVGIPMYATAGFHVQDINSAYDTTYNVPHTGMNPFFNRVEVYQYIDTIVFPASGQYKISWEDCCRNGAILNMSNPLGESMYFKTEVTVDNVVPNSTPEFLNPPITLAQKFSLFQYNPLPFDADGDSLSWIMETPLGSNGDTVAGYTLPHADPLNPFTLNPTTGELTWMPDSNGFWEASFRVEEYRGGIKIGEIRRDMQIIVVDDTSNWHSIVFDNGGWPQDGQGNYAMSMAPNVPFNLTLNITDLDNDPLALSVQGEPMILSNNPAQWTITNNAPGSVTGMFNWTPLQSQARALPYVLAFRGYEFHNLSTYTTDQTLLLYVNTANGIKNVNQDFAAGRLFPNPNAGNWFLSFELKKSAHVIIEVMDVVGQKVASVLDQTMPSGTNLVQNTGLKLESGYYFVQVNVNGQKATSYPVVIE
jgi:hypothetical protein